MQCGHSLRFHGRSCATASAPGKKGSTLCVHSS